MVVFFSLPVVAVALTFPSSSSVLFPELDADAATKKPAWVGFVEGGDAATVTRGVHWETAPTGLDRDPA